MRLAIDPGESSGLAWFDRGVLVSAYGCGVDHSDAVPVVPFEVVIEIPRVYPHGKADPNDLLVLAVTAGRWIERCRGAKITRVFPRDWKGQTPKRISHERARKVLAPSELHVWETLPKRGILDVRDAIALGLWSHGRY